MWFEKRQRRARDKEGKGERKKFPLFRLLSHYMQFQSLEPYYFTFYLIKSSLLILTPGFLYLFFAVLDSFVPAKKI